MWKLGEMGSGGQSGCAVHSGSSVKNRWGRPFSGISHTIPVTQLDNLLSHTGQQSLARIIM